jgi:alginate O-acetyltransferase complex protein AlgJ
LDTKTTHNPASTTYSAVFLSIFLGSLLIPFMTISAGLTGLLDKFQGKARFINAYTETRLTLGDQVFNRSLVGTDGWFNLTDEYAIADYQNAQPLPAPRLQYTQLALENFQERVEADGGVFLFVIPPNKPTIYPEHVPDTLSRREGPSRLDQLISHLAKNDSPVRVLDLRPTLLEAKQTHQLYFATDSHWNPIGAFFAYQKIIEALQSSFPGLSPHSFSDYKIVTYDPTPMGSRIIGSTSLVEAPFVLTPIHTSRARIFSVELPTQFGPIFFSQTDDKSSPTALVFTDSFFIAIRPFISEHFSRAVYIDYFATPEISHLSWYEQFQPDVVIFSLTERNIGAIPSLFGN